MTEISGKGKLYVRPLTEADKRPEDWQEIGYTHASGWTEGDAAAWPQRWVVTPPAGSRVTFFIASRSRRLLDLFFGGPLPRPPRRLRHPDMASKPHVPVKPSARSRRRTR